jgi:hypothetical protein
VNVVNVMTGDVTGRVTVETRRDKEYRAAARGALSSVERELARLLDPPPPRKRRSP